ncbi:ABC transporter substrate-binding protein [Gorillibacterium sp. sgz5001074]|uniref:ABC transporter substrate-binding protein n=1 Tax=Gorillibacterium sp. sgz5001074 TaxID=3446695 RepID=UPI003F67A2F7
MGKMKKTGLAVLGLTMTLSAALTGCGDDKEASSSVAPSKAATASPAAATTVASESPAAALKPAKLRMVFPGTAQKDQAAVTQEINNYLQKKINATVTIEPIQWGQWDNKVNLMVASREEVDVVFTAQWTNYAVNAGKGAFLALNDDKGKYGNLLKKHGQDILKAFDANIMKGSQIDGVNYAVPTLKEMASQGGIVYRSDVAQELGIDDKVQKAQTIEELIPLLETVKEKKPDFTPLFLRDGENFNSHYFANWDFLGDSNVEGVILKDEDAVKIKNRMEIDRYKTILKTTRDMFNKGLINKDAATTQLSTNDAMKSGKVFMVVAPLKPGKDSEVAAAVGLAGKLKQVALNKKTTATSETAGSMLAISSTSKEPERAMMLINLLHTDKYLNNLLNFGIENTHFRKTGDNYVDPTDKTGDYSPGASWMFGSQFLNYIWKDEPRDKWDQFKKFNEGTHFSKALGFTFDVNEGIKNKVAATITIRKQYDPALDTGSVDPDKVLPEYQQKMKASGVDDILAEKQKQFDAFLAKK